MTRPHWVLALLLAMVLPAWGQDDDDPRPKYLPGLVGQYTGADGKSHRRVDERLAFVWHDRRPDPRLSTGNFSARWQGRLFSIRTGEYRLHLYAAGAVKVHLQDKVILDGKSNEPAWLSSQPVKLNYGHHPLRIEFEKTSDHARVSLYWQGPNFAFEPVPARHLFHDPADSPGGQFHRGQLLTRALRCAACHRIPGHDRPLPAAALTHLAGNLDESWLVDWIQHAGHREQGQAIHRMPAYGLSRDEAKAISAYLLSNSDATPKEPPGKKPPRRTKKKGKKKPRGPDAKIGRDLFVTLGCLACHQLGHLGSDGPFGGGDLSRVAQKRPADFFARWLADPSKTNQEHRMPVFRLDRQERLDLAAYLTTLKDPKAKPARGAASDGHQRELAARGRALIVQHRCHACHRTPGDLPAMAEKDRSLLGANSGWDGGCVGDPDARKQRPGFRLSEEVTAAIREYVTSAARPPKHAPRVLDGHLVMAERNCLSCHSRGTSAGIAAQLLKVIEAHPKLAPLLPAMKPPSLLEIGDKFHEQALADAIATKHDPLRPWLKIRMPRFDLSKEEQQAIVKHFVDTDRIAPLPAKLRSPVGKKRTPTALQIAGQRLVTSSGFGCTSCHQIGRAMAEKDEIRSRGPNLALLGRRVRREWYDRFMPNPPRMVPNMEMPALVTPIRGVLGDDLDDQLAAVWHVLNQPDFSPPQPGAVRVVRSRNLPGKPERAKVLTDVLEVGKQVYIKPLLIGLPNRHNVLFDLETNRLAGWWIGDTARQRTRGKTWYWEPGGTHLFPPKQGESELQRLRGEKRLPPLLAGQFPSEFDWFEHVPGGIRFGQRVRFNPTIGDDPLVIHVTQTFTVLTETPAKQGRVGRSGFRRRIEIRPVPLDFQFALWFLPEGIVKDTPVFRHANQRSPAFQKEARTKRFEIRPARISIKSKKSAMIEVDYLTPLPVDRFPIVAPPLPAPSAEKLPVAPGFEAAALPLADEIMPTALAWRNDGTLIVAGLKGRVWLGQDTDNDGLEDKLIPFSQDLAAPYGVAAHGDAIDVLNKYAVLRLHDDDHDGHADRTVTVASGWGHTRDYHDWAVGLPKDEHGNYYIALPCQQDQRSQVAAKLRGTAIKLIPRKPTADDPRAYRMEVICAGLRFPMGLARNRAGALFATDNQGNYNPFNELNHLRPGRRYGFINKLEFRPDFKPPLTPPAIDIPHPWTRSVNGIAFLYTPSAVHEKLGRDLFGPFEGHLIGCEYDTRRLIRMSLQEIGDTYQGAAYPFTAEPPKGAAGLQGPICCAVAPDGDIYIGNMRDSGWGGGSNVGSLVRLRPQGKLPTGIAEVRVTADGFAIDFTAPVHRRLASQAENYSVSSYRRISTPAYGGKDQDRRSETVRSVEVSTDARRVSLKIDNLRVGFVYEFRLKSLIEGDARFHPAEAHYTLRRIPQS